MCFPLVNLSFIAGVSAKKGEGKRNSKFRPFQVQSCLLGSHALWRGAGPAGWPNSHCLTPGLQFPQTPALFTQLWFRAPTQVLGCPLVLQAEIQEQPRVLPTQRKLRYVARPFLAPSWEPKAIVQISSVSGHLSQARKRGAVTMLSAPHLLLALPSRQGSWTKPRPIYHFGILGTWWIPEYGYTGLPTPGPHPVPTLGRFPLIHR